MATQAGTETGTDRHPDRIGDALERELTDLLIRQSAAPLAISLLSMALVSWLLQSVVDTSGLLLWLLVGIAVNAVRALLMVNLRRRRRRGENPSRLPITLIALLGGLHWGALAYFWSADVPLFGQLVMMLVPVTLASTALISYGPSLSAYLAFAIGATLPLAVAFLLSADTSMHALSIGGMLITVGLAAVGRGWNRQIRSMLRLKLRNELLARDLETQNQALARAQEETAIANRERERFLTRMSHEFRTPMNGILGMAQVLESSELEPSQQEALRTLKSSGGDMLRLINELLEIAGIAGDTAVRHTGFAIRPTLMACLAGHESAAMDKNLQVSAELDDALPAWLVGDAERISRVLDILIGNAVKVTDAGSVVLAAQWAAEDGRLDLSVTDTGKGFEADQQQRLFELFSQLDATDTRQFEGTGNGLYLAASLVQALDGEIRVHSTPGAGTRFTLSLPMAQAPDGPLAARILVAEDNPVNQAVVEAMLEDLGCSVIIVDDGAQAVEALHCQPFDMVFMDCQMPVMDGLQATRSCRELGLTIPIVALTAHATEHDRQACMQCGMNDFLTKPYSIEALRSMVQGWAGTALPHAA